MATIHAVLSRIPSSVYSRGARNPYIPEGLQEAGKVYAASGAVLPKPPMMRFPVLKSLAVIIPGVYIGAVISANMAAFLEEHDIFVPDDDD